jgi:hypothetical protein
VRIGTWNLAGRWSDEHQSFLVAMDCDVLLLTEVNDRVELPGFAIHRSDGLMAARRRWAAVASIAPLKALPDPHTASAAVEIDDVVFCSSILPWRSCGRGPTWGEGSLADRTGRAVQQIVGSFAGRPVVWGGDWNHALTGREYAGSIGGRHQIQAAVRALGLTVSTADLPHRIEGVLSIDHVAVPTEWTSDARRLVAQGSLGRLSDHDAYVVSAARHVD